MENKFSQDYIRRKPECNYGGWSNYSSIDTEEHYIREFLKTHSKLINQEY